jgi:hypothetical protein
MGHTLAMFFRVLLIVISLFFAGNSYAKNVVYIVVEGTSRSTLYSLINQNKIPNYKTIIDRGNYRNLGIDKGLLANHDSTLIAYSGFSSQQFHEQSVVDKLKFYKPDLDIHFILSSPIEKEYPVDVNASLVQLASLSNSPSLTYKTSSEIGNEAINFITNTKNPFLLVLNFTNVDYVGWRYREGGQKYSLAVKNTDTSIGKIIDVLKKINQFENTEFLITTNYGYHQKLQVPNNEGWVVSTQKVLRKGTIYDVFPSLLDLLEIDDTDSIFKSGYSLFKVKKSS